MGLHVATAAALFVYFRKDWMEIIKGILQTFVTRKIDTPVQRLGWLLVVTTIPAGIQDSLHGDENYLVNAHIGVVKVI